MNEPNRELLQPFAKAAATITAQPDALRGLEPSSGSNAFSQISSIAELIANSPSSTVTM